MLYKNLEESINKIKEMNGNSCDISVHEINLNKSKIAYVFLESTSSDDKISDFLGKTLSVEVRKENVFNDLFKYLENTIPNSKIKTVDNYEDLFYYLASGFTCILVNGYSKAIIVETKGNLDRAINESSSEPVLKGPKDSFNENYQNTIGLIRKRIKDPNLYFTEVKVGRRTKTKVSLAYIKDIADEKKVKRLLNQLKKLISME